MFIVMDRSTWSSFSNELKHLEMQIGMTRYKTLVGKQMRCFPGAIYGLTAYK